MVKQSGGKLHLKTTTSMHLRGYEKYYAKILVMFGSNNKRQ